MAPIRSPKKRRGPKPIPVSLRQLSQRELKPIAYPERTYSQNQKLRVLTFLETHQIPLSEPGQSRHPTQKEAADLYRIPQGTISDWVQKKERIERYGKNSPVKKEESLGYSKRLVWPELEEQLYKDFIERREAGRTVRQGWFRLHSQFQFRSIYPDSDPTSFQFTNGWFRGFLSRHKISLRSITNKAQKLPSDYEKLILNWLRFNRRNSQPRSDHFWEVVVDHPVGRYELANICNLDETPIPFEYLHGKTYNKEGEKTVRVKETRSGWDKRQATLVLCIFADGIARVPLLVIFHGTGRRLQAERQHYDQDVLVEFNSTAYMNDSLFEQYVRNHLIPVLGGRPTLFALDLMGSHKTPRILNLLHQHDITPSLIPGGCTSLVQPLDVSVNKPFKELLRDLTDERIFQLESVAEFEKWTIRDRRIMTTECVGTAFRRFHQEKGEVIRRAFQHVGLSLPIDGHSDYQLAIKGFKSLEIGDWREELGTHNEGAEVVHAGDHEIELVHT